MFGWEYAVCLSDLTKRKNGAARIFKLRGAAFVGRARAIGRLVKGTIGDDETNHRPQARISTSIGRVEPASRRAEHSPDGADKKNMGRKSHKKSKIVLAKFLEIVRIIKKQFCFRVCETQ
ncbi:MAG: hypothetical protein JW959_07185 [Pirellulales bacterium]|nr:hypothetical protein [Pirellulales bacterium]